LVGAQQTMNGYFVNVRGPHSNTVEHHFKSI